jgi:bacterioferritin
MADNAKTQQIIADLITAYTMEIETTVNYICNSTNLDGVRAEEIKKALAVDIVEELGHAQQLAKRIKTIGGQVPGSLALSFGQQACQPPSDNTDVVTVIKGVIAAEQAAIAQYTKIIQASDGVDYVTQDLCITLMGDEEEHLRTFKGYLTEYEKG